MTIMMMMLVVVVVVVIKMMELGDWEPKFSVLETQPFPKMHLLGSPVWLFFGFWLVNKFFEVQPIAHQEWELKQESKPWGLFFFLFPI